MDEDVQNCDSAAICREVLNYSCRHRYSECPFISGIFRAVVQGNLTEVKRWVESGGNVNEKIADYDYSLLHLAVVREQVEILEYLLTRDGIQVDCNCSTGDTPFYRAIELGHIKSVKKLIQTGADVNMADYDNITALHMSVNYPDMCHLLIRHGALIDVVNGLGHTPLHDAVFENNIETVHMLLYYNADVNVVGTDSTPFSQSLSVNREEAQKALLEYVDDFDRVIYQDHGNNSVLGLVLLRDLPLVKDLIERGADVNYGDDPRFDLEYCAFNSCIRYSVHSSTFKLIWERLRYNETRNTIDLLEFLDYIQVVPAFVQVIIDSDNFQPAIEFFSKGDNYFLFVNKFAEKKFDLDQLTALTCRLLEYGFRLTSYDIHAILSNYGYCELFRILLYMDNDFVRGWLPEMAFSRLIFDIDYNLQSIVEVNYIPGEVLIQLLEYSICPRLVDGLILSFRCDENMSAILSRLPKVPSLVELARNAARKQIWQAFKITNTCQFFTIIDHLDIPTIYKDFLTFKRKMYSIM